MADTPADAPPIDHERALQTLAGDTCDHAGYLGNCPVCLDRYLALRRVYRGEAVDAHTQAEICICAAWKTTEGPIVRGHRHSHCRDTALAMHLTPSRVPGAQGFITSTARFVGRDEGAELMQLVHFASVFTGHQFESATLFSEDLY